MLIVMVDKSELTVDRRVCPDFALLGWVVFLGCL